jgi:hypothetical protein
VKQHGGLAKYRPVFSLSFIAVTNFITEATRVKFCMKFCHNLMNLFVVYLTMLPDSVLLTAWPQCSVQPYQMVCMKYSFPYFTHKVEIVGRLLFVFIYVCVFVCLFAYISRTDAPIYTKLGILVP